MFFPIIKIFNYCEYLSFYTFACINVPCIVELCPVSAERKQYSQQLFLLFPIILYSKLKKASTVNAFLNIFHFHIGNFFFGEWTNILLKMYYLETILNDICKIWESYMYKTILDFIYHQMVTKASIKSSFDPNDKCPRAYILLFVIVIYIPIKHLK